MRLQCPWCELEAALASEVAAGTKLRCARCGRDFLLGANGAVQLDPRMHFSTEHEVPTPQRAGEHHPAICRIPNTHLVMVVCPSCVSRYRMYEAVLDAAGTALQCTRCGYTFHSYPLPKEVPAGSDWVRLMAAHPASFDAVFGAPLDDSRRRVLADVLIERGEPLGELMALQLSGGAGAADVGSRLAVLMHEYVERWSPRGGRVLAFSRGLPSHVTVNGPTDSGDPLWRTVERLTLERGGDRELLSTDTLGELRELDLYSGDDLYPIARGPRRDDVVRLSMVKPVVNAQLWESVSRRLIHLDAVSVHGGFGALPPEDFVRGLPSSVRRLQLAKMFLTRSVLEAAARRPVLHVEAL